MKIITFLNQVKATLLPDAPVPHWSNTSIPKSDLLMEIYPSKCKVTINENIVIDNVYVYQLKDGEYGLYKDYSACGTLQSAYYSGLPGESRLSERERLSIFPVGKDLVLQFKSDNFTIEAI